MQSRLASAAGGRRGRPHQTQPNGNKNLNPISNKTQSNQIKSQPPNQVDDLNAVASDVDVLYMTRIQKERFTDMAEYAAARGEREGLAQRVIEMMIGL